MSCASGRLGGHCRPIAHLCSARGIGRPCFISQPAVARQSFVRLEVAVCPIRSRRTRPSVTRRKIRSADTSPRSVDGKCFPLPGARVPLTVRLRPSTEFFFPLPGAPIPLTRALGPLARPRDPLARERDPVADARVPLARNFHPVVASRAPRPSSSRSVTDAHDPLIVPRRAGPVRRDRRLLRGFR